MDLVLEPGCPDPRAHPRWMQHRSHLRDAVVPCSRPQAPPANVTDVLPAESPLPETFGFSEMSAVARFGTSEISVQARFRVRTFFRCAQVKNFSGLECLVSMVVVQPQDLSNWHAKGLKKYLLPQQALFCGNAGHTVW